MSKSIENLREVTLPLDMEQIKDFYENKERFFLIRYKDSQLKGGVFHTYVGNLEIPCEIIYEGVSKEERFDLLRSYLETRSLNHCNSLRLTVAQLLLIKKGFQGAESCLREPVLSLEECHEFLAENKEVMDRWDMFLSSTMLYMLTSVSILEEEYRFKESYPVIDDPRYIGTNVVNLFSVPMFMESFFSLPSSPQIAYFPQQFEEYMFKGKNLFHYFCNEENTLFLLFNSFLDGSVSVEEFESLIRQT